MENQTLTRKCKRCKTPFTPGFGLRYHCSLECRGKDLNTPPAPKAEPPKQRICRGCGRLHSRKLHSRLAWFCSEACQKLHYRVKKFDDFSPAEFIEMYEEQDGCCKICGRDDLLETLAIDHCHRNGKVRGLLCKKCNAGLGYFDDNIGKLKNAIDYLRAA